MKHGFMTKNKEKTGEVIVGSAEHGCGLGKRQLCYPTDIFITSKNVLYIADSVNKRIQKYNTEDDIIETVISEGLFEPISISVTPETDEIYILDRINEKKCTVKKLSLNNITRNSPYLITVVINAPLDVCYDLFLDKDLNIYIAKEFDVRKWFSPGYFYSIQIAIYPDILVESQTRSTIAIYIDDENNNDLYLYDPLYRSSSIQKWSFDSFIGTEIIPRITRNADFDRKRIGFTLDCNKNIYFSYAKNDDVKTYVIYQFNQENNRTIVITDSNLSEISAIEFDSYGNLYVAEYLKHQIKKFAIMN
ncbi:unnamed protein product [Didymodactylos carnosus]|uniref:Uncharacterized protein n=1 Tax=Didymodactylos carnosus TaxID=1234261 RepID=A0A8S2D8Z6_9BILA|nr:unnamed protein product [Didymodactylos carnosus]CAF3688080.1 unnamed protein product [Didymodactylos carnosus]